AVLCSLVLRAAQLPLLAGGGVLLLAGVAMAVPPFATDAYPTTYQRPAVPYQAASIAAGAALYARDCATCHGSSGGGDGPAARALRDYRGARIVLVVVYTLPASRPRLAELAARYETLSPLGVEIIAVPADGAPDAIKRLGAESRIFFPVVTDGAPEIVRTYG